MDGHCKHSRLIDSTDDDGFFMLRCCLCGKQFDILEIVEILQNHFKKSATKISEEQSA